MSKTVKRGLSLALSLMLVLTLLPVSAVNAADAAAKFHVSADLSEMEIGDTVEFEVTVSCADLAALEFTLVIPEGLRYNGDAAIPAGLKGYLGWDAADWTESIMKWSGYSITGADVEEGTVFLTFSCTAETAGTYEIVLDGLLPYDSGFEEIAFSFAADSVTVNPGATEPIEPPTEPIDPPTEPIEPSTEPIEPPTEPIEPPTEPVDPPVVSQSFDVSISADKTDLEIGDTVNYTVAASCADLLALEFTLVIPEGLGYNGDAAIPAGLKEYLGWDAADWTESTMKWTGYSLAGAAVEEGTVFLTFSCTAETAGTYEIVLDGLLPYDSGFEEVVFSVTADSVTVNPGATEPIEPPTEPIEPPTEPIEPPTEPVDPPVVSQSFDVSITADKTDLEIGDTVNYTVAASCADLLALEFTVVIPEGLCYNGDAAIPSGLKEYLGWDAADWTESTMKWTGYSLAGAAVEEGTVFLTFSCTAETAGTYEITLENVVPIDSNYDECVFSVSSDAVTVNSNPIVTPDEPEEPADAVYFDITADRTQVSLGQTVFYTVAVCYHDLLALEFTLVIPEGLRYNGDAAIPAVLKGYLGWDAVDWTESSMKWTGYSLAGAAVEEGTVYLTFSCTAEGVGTYEVSLENVVCSDGNFEEAAYVISGESVTVSLCQHVFTDYVSNGDATCTEDGTKTAPCANGCGTTDTVTDEGSALGHSFTQYVSNGDAICEEDGTKTAICDRCDETDTVVDEGTAPGHFFYRYVSNNDATCTEDGTKTALCECCGAPDTVTDEGSALGHAFNEYISNGDATCTEDGTKTAACDHGCGETDTVTDEGSALGHAFSDYISNGDATCTADGTKTAACDHGCGETDTVTDEGSALGHAFSDYISNGDATCIADGTKTAACDHGCGETDTITDEGSALGHAFNDYISNGDATCTADGTKTAACDHGCGETDTVTDEGSALGHAFSDYISNGDATCTADGTKTAACDHGCGETDTVTDTGSMLPHAYEEGICRHCGQLDPDAAFLNISIICKTESTLTVLIEGPNGVSISVNADENGECYFGGLLPGSYTVTVSAGNHVSRTLEITLVKGENGLETVLSLQGDVDNNGRVNIIDLAQIYSHIKGVSRLRDEYAIACADIIAGGLNIIDLAQLYARIKAA